jgi:hypothetical protein
MPAKKAKLLPSADAWRPMQLQMIAFPDAPAVDLGQSWYTDVAGQPPQEAVKRGHERFDKGPAPGMKSADLTVAVDLLKITLTVTPRITPEVLNQLDPVERIPTLGPFPQARDWFVELMAGWLKGKHPPLKRLAFSGKLIQFTDSQESAYKKVSNYLPTVRLGPSASDLIYRINRRRPSTSGIRKLQMNRLSTWTVMRMALQAQGVLATGEMWAPTIAAELFAFAMDFDVNTALEFLGMLPPKKLVTILRECAKLATEIAERGDVL